MNFREIKEAAKLPKKTEAIFHEIYQNCQQYLQEVGNKPYKYAMYRGISGIASSAIPGLAGHDFDESTFGKKDVRLNDRKPLDTGEQEHAQVNAALKELYGHPYRNGLFVSGNYNVASGYGDLYCVFPIGKYEYIWHDTIDDLYSHVAGYDEAWEHWIEFGKEVLDPEIVKAKVGFEPDPDEDYDEDYEDAYLIAFEELIPDLIDEYGVGELLKWLLKSEGAYRQTGLRTALAHPRKEIMIWVPSYYYMNPDWLPIFQKWLSK